MCSKKCANPGSSLGSQSEPTPTLSAQAALSHSGSEIKMTSNLLGRTIWRYCRLSEIGRSRSKVLDDIIEECVRGVVAADERDLIGE